MTLIFGPGTSKPHIPQANVRAVPIRRFADGRLGFASILLIASLGPLLRAQQKEPVPGPPPSSSTAPSATRGNNFLPRVFVSFPISSGSPAHNTFYAAIKKSGQFELVDDPAQADQILEMIVVSSSHCVQSTVEPFEDVFNDTSLELAIMDRHGPVLRGPYTVDAKSARLQRNEEKNFLQAIDTLVRWAAPQAISAAAKFAAQKDAKIEPPVPAPISRATTVFISNFVQDKTGALKAGVPDDLYRQFYTAMQKWGRYKLVSSPAGADLLIDLAVSRTHVQGCNFPDFHPRIELRMRLPPSNLVIYGFQWPLRGRALYAHLIDRVISLSPSQEDLQQTSEAMVDYLRRLAARGDATGTPAKGVQ